MSNDGFVLRRHLDVECGAHGSEVMGSRRILGIVLLLVAGLTVAAVLLQPPAWLVLLLGSMALALLYTVARLNSRFDPLDQRFGSCIPPINWPPRDQK